MLMTSLSRRSDDGAPLPEGLGANEEEGKGIISSYDDPQCDHYPIHAMPRSPLFVVCDQPENVEAKISSYRVRFISANALRVKKRMTLEAK
jgi:hypothetical protein